MLLTSLEIKNYRSLEHVKLDQLGQFNVLIGRNNTGKTAIFGALAYLNERFHQNSSSIPSDRILPVGTRESSLELRLIFSPLLQERKEFIDQLCAIEHLEANRDALQNSSLLRQLEFIFTSFSGNPLSLNLRETKVQTEDNKWAVIQKRQEQPPSLTSKIVHLGAVAHGAEQPVSALLDIESGNLLNFD